MHKGRYHVLGGLISPMDGMGPRDLTVDELVRRVENEGIEEVILALSATMEGDTTAFYIYRKLGDLPIRHRHRPGPSRRRCPRIRG